MLSLKELLQKVSPDNLEILRKSLHLKVDAADPQRLLQRLDNSDRTRKVFSELNPTEKHVLRYLLSQGGIASEVDILARYPDAASAIGRLREQYLVFDDVSEGEGPVLSIPREYVRFISLTPGEKSTLANLFSKQPAVYSSDVATAHGWEKTSPRLVMQKLKQTWPTEERLNAFIGQRSVPEQSLWNRIVRQDGTIDIKTLKDDPGTDAVVQPGHLDRTRPLDSLYAYGLLFPNQWPNPTCYIIPSDLMLLIKGKSAAKNFTAAIHSPSQLRTWGLRLLSDLQLLAAYQASGRLEFTQHDIPLRHQLRAFLKGIGVPEETYGLFLNMSIEVFFGAVIKKTTQTLDSNPAESMSRLIASWRDGESWQESAHWRDRRRSPDGALDKSLKAKRLIVLKVLERLPARQWVSYSDFEAAVYESGWKRVDSGIKAPNAYYHNERWPTRVYEPELSSEETLANMTAESLVWLGLIDIGTGKSRKIGWDITHVRLSDWGRQFMDKKSGRFEPLPSVQSENQFRVLPNLEISVSPRLRPDLLAQLFKMAALKGVNSFSLTKDSLRQALDEGMTREAILDFLRDNSAHDLSPMVVQFVEEVAQKHGHIKLGIAGAYLQVDDPVLMLELRSHRALKDIFGKQVGDKLTLLTDKDLERIAKTLRKKGYFPVIEKSAETERLKMRFHW